MFPMEFDHTVLDSLPLPTEEDAKRVITILEVIISRRVLPYLKTKRGTDPIVAARVGESLKIERLEDYDNRVRCVSLLSRSDKQWIISVHERVFDYFAFVIPSDPQARLGAGTVEEHKMLAVGEFMLRHEVERVAYPERSEREIIHGDVEFAMDRRAEDPTFYRMLRRALGDEMNGLRGEAYLRLLDYAEQDRDLDEQILNIVNPCVLALGDLPDEHVEKVFPCLDAELKTKLLGVCYRSSLNTSYPLFKRTYFLHKLLRLFDLLLDGDEKEAEVVFDGFKDSWGLVFLLQELNLPQSSVEDKSVREIFQLFKKSLKQFSAETRGLFDALPQQPTPAKAEPKPAAPAPKSLKDRIEEARNNLFFPSQVMEVVDKNKLNAVGHSGSKYSELIETLLAIPWGKIKKIDVSPEAFEEQLNKSHYGLQKPKELICDFFSNLIWRYKRFSEESIATWRQNGSAFLFVGPPGVGKTSLAISIARNLDIPYHKLSLGGMRDETDLKGHGFTYEGSKPGAIVQGIIKMGVMNGMFILDEADKTEKFAIATLLEILDPEQNHLFHDKFTQTTVDIDLSNFHFVLTANTLETVPPPVVNRCEVVTLERYSVEEKVEIARKYLIERVRERHEISLDQISLDPDDEAGLLKYLIKTYTYEAGVRELERIIRTLFLRIMRKEILTARQTSVRITREKLKEYLDTPQPPRRINDDDRVGEIMGLGINVELGIGSVVPIQATPIRLGSAGKTPPGFLSMIHATGNIQKIMDESRKVATTAILLCGDRLGIDIKKEEEPIHLHCMGGSTPKDGPSAGGAIALALASVFSGKPIRRDVAMTGEIDTHGRITRIGGLDVKLDTASDAGCKTVIIPTENFHSEDGVNRLSDALRRELQILSYDQWKGDHKPFNYEKHVLQIVAVDDIVQAADVAFIDEAEIVRLEELFLPYAAVVAEQLATDRSSSHERLRVLYIREARELDFGDDLLPWHETGCLFLVDPRSKKDVSVKHPALEEHSLLWEFQPAQHNIADVLTEIVDSVLVDPASTVELEFIAPYFFMDRQRVCLDGLSIGPNIDSITFYANNFAVQGVKIKACKPALNRLFCVLSQLDPQHLSDCPFLKRRDCIFAVDFSFIPEKYRLDVQRGERILSRVVRKWLTAVQNALPPAHVQEA